MTACVSPPGNMSNTVLLDAQIREKQYINAIRFYLTNTSLPIIFIDNSDTDLSYQFQKEINIGRIEFLNFNGNNFNPILGKGYGEGLIIQYALDKSKFLTHASRVIKITGRLIIPNINNLLAYANKNNLVYANRMKDKYGKLMCHSYFFIIPTSKLIVFSNNISEINEQKHLYFEHILYKTVYKYNQEFKLPIILEGMSGTSGITYHYSHIDYFKAFVNYWLHKCGIYQETFFPKLKKYFQKSKHVNDD